MRPNEIVKEIDKLGLSKKLILVEDIWDGIAIISRFLKPVLIIFRIFIHKVHQGLVQFGANIKNIINIK